MPFFVFCERSVVGSVTERTIEDILLQGFGKPSRGMELLRPHLPPDYCRKAAVALLAAERGNVLLNTGFYVAGTAETDGPPGTLFLAKALNRLGFCCTVVTDEYCRGWFEKEGVAVESLLRDADALSVVSLLDRYRPKALVAIERCGINAQGNYANMSGESIAAHTAKMDPLFDEGRRRGILTVGIGDGGNEIGMGGLRGVIESELSLSPCVTEVDFPVIATVSNWGAYGLCAALQRITGERLLPCPEEIRFYLASLAAMGSVDGVTRQHTPTVDGFPEGTEETIIRELSESFL